MDTIETELLELRSKIEEAHKRLLHASMCNSTPESTGLYHQARVQYDLANIAYDRRLRELRAE